MPIYISAIYPTLQPQVLKYLYIYIYKLDMKFVN